MWTSRLTPLLSPASSASPRRPRLVHDFCRHRDDHPVHAARLGRLGWRVPGHDRRRSVPDEGRRAAGRILLSAEAGRAEGREVVGNQPTTILRRSARRPGEHLAYA